MHPIAPGWIPLNSASSGAAFAGVLAAIVITISIQISTRGSERAALSLKAAPPTLVLLMVAAYLYIVLDGIPNTSTEIVDVLALVPASESDFSDPARYYADIASRGFAVSGTVLALGALMTLFIVTASVFDNGPYSPSKELEPQVWALAVFRVTVFTIVSILLLGYMVGAQIGGAGTPCWWWVLHTFLCGGPATLVALFASSGVLKTVERTAQGARRRPTLLIFLVAAVPAIVALLIVSTSILNWVPFNVLSAGSAAYFGLCSAALLMLLEVRDQKDRASRNPNE